MLSNRMMMVAAGAVVTVDASFTANSVSGTNASPTFTFSSVALGAADANRKIVVAVTVSGSAPAITITAVSVGGQSATQIIALKASNMPTEIWIASVPSGTTGDIAITVSGATGESWGIGVYRLVGASPTADDTGTSTADPMAANINCPAGGVIISAVSVDNASTVFAWTNLTEQYDETREINYKHSGAFDTFATQQTGLAVSCQPSPVPTATKRVFVIASFGPG